MTTSFSPAGTDAAPASHHDGMVAGLLGATAVWVWLLLCDAVAGHPLHTAASFGAGLLSLNSRVGGVSLLGGTIAFTIVHYLVWIGLGALVMSGVRAAARTPAVLIFMFFVFCLLQLAFVAFTALMAARGLGASAWWLVFAGNVIGCAITWWYILRHHPEIRTEFHEIDPNAP
jgi:hypothetical protein